MAPALELERVSKVYRQRGRSITAVDEVDLTLAPGEILCLVGESGSGKSTIGRLVTGLAAPSAGEIRYDGAPATDLRRKELRSRRLGVQMVQQDPYAALNPGMTVGQTLAAPLTRHTQHRHAEVIARVHELLADVGLTPPETFSVKFPHELSGGQRQRVAIARSLTVDPRVLVADEALSMLDVSIRVSVLRMLRNLCQERQLALLFITHDLAVARQFGNGHSIAVMQRGRIVEHRPTRELITNPEHTYTQALLKAARHDELRSARTARARTADEPDRSQESLESPRTRTERQVVP